LLSSEDCPLTPAGRIRRPSEILCRQWIKTTWNYIPPESPRNDMNGREDDALQEDNHKEAVLPVLKLLLTELCVCKLLLH
jgi:hypothetical protein